VTQLEIMRSIIIVGPDITLDLDYVRKQVGDEIQITENTLPEDGVAIYNCGRPIDWSWPNEVGLIGTCLAVGRKNVDHLQGPDYNASTIAWIQEGMLTQPPEENDEGVSPAGE